MKNNTPKTVLILGALAVVAAFIISNANAQGKITAGSAREAELLVKYDANANGKLDPAEIQTMKEHELMASKKKGGKKK
jgi:hypothetical protein